MVSVLTGPVRRRGLRQAAAYSLPSAVYRLSRSPLATNPLPLPLTVSRSVYYALPCPRRLRWNFPGDPRTSHNGDPRLLLVVRLFLGSAFSFCVTLQECLEQVVGNAEGRFP